MEQRGDGHRRVGRREQDGPRVARRLEDARLRRHALGRPAREHGPAARPDGAYGALMWKRPLALTLPWKVELERVELHYVLQSWALLPGNRVSFLRDGKE